jgi:non-ribosomal peptide synthetase component F
LQVLFQHLEGHLEQLPEDLAASLASSTTFCDVGAPAAYSSRPDLAILVQNRSIIAQYSLELFNASTIEHMLQSYLKLLQQLVKAPSTAVGMTPVLRQRDQQLLMSWGAGEQRPDFLSKPMVHESFAAAAAAAPESCCLVFEGNSLSYGEVEQRVGHLAAVLQAAGVGPGVAVGVLLERSLELPIAVLAVFMAGGCYVPLDPSYPEQRLQGYLEDSGAALVVTHSALGDLVMDLTGDLNARVSGSGEICQAPWTSSQPWLLAILLGWWFSY